MNEFKNGLIEFSKTPVGIAICIGIFVLFYVVLFLTKTDFGKRISKKAKSLANEAVEKAKESKAEVVKAKEDLQTKKVELEKHIEEKLAIAEEHTIKLEKLLLAIGVHIHNDKVQALLEEYKKETKDKLEDISSIIKEKVDETKNEYDKKLAELDTKIAELDNLLNKVKEMPLLSEKGVENEQE